MENKMQLLKTRNFTDVINDTLGFIKLNIKPMLQVILFLVLPILVFGCFFFSRYFTAIMGVAGHTDPTAVTQAIMGSVGSIALGYIGIIIGSVCLYLTVTEAFLKYEASETGVIEASDIFDGIKKDFLRFIGFSFAFGVIVITVFSLIIGLIAGVAVAGSGGIAALLGFVAFFAFFYGMIAIIFTPFIYMRERNGIFNALSRSFYLIKGHWWQTFGVIFVVYMIMYFASLIFIIPFYAMFFASLLHGISGGGAPSFEMSSWGTVAFVFMMCGVTIMASMIHVAVAMQYYSLVEKKEGVDVMQQIENIGSPDNPIA